MVYECPLVQANARNKRLLFDGIDMLVDRNIASYSQALEFAYSGKNTKAWPTKLSKTLISQF